MLLLVCIGLAGLVGYLVFTQSNRGRQEAAALPPTITPLQPTFTPTSTPTATPTETPLPTPTSTTVVGNNGEPVAAPADENEPLQIAPTDTPDPNATPTSTLVIPATGTVMPGVTPGSPPAAEMPAGGGVLPTRGTGYLIWVGVGMLLLLILGVYNYLKVSSPEA
jgi:hypothetical protein